MVNKNLLHDYMDLLRNRDYSECGYSLYNIVNVMKLSRDNFICGECFDNLDFRNIHLNSINFSRTGITPSSFSNSTLYEDNFMSGHSDDIHSVAFSPDGQFCLTGSKKELIIWEISTGFMYKKINIWVRKIVFSPRGDYILILGRETVVLVNTVTYEVHKELKKHTDYISEAVFSPDGVYFLTGSEDKTAIIWDVNTGKIHKKLVQHKKEIEAVAFSFDGRLCVTCSHEKIILWNTKSGKPYATSEKYTADITSAGFSPCRRYLLFDGYGEQLQAVLWDLETLTIKHIYAHNFCLDVGFSPDGKYCYTYERDEGIILWNVETGKLHRQFANEYNINDFSFSPDGKYLLTSSLSMSQNTAALWDVENGKILREFDGHNPIGMVAFSPNGKFCFGATKNTAIIWDEKTGKIQRRLSGHIGITSAILSPDEEYCLSLYNSTGILWNLKSGIVYKKLIHNSIPFHIEISTIKVCTAVFSHDSKYCIIGGGITENAIIWYPEANTVKELPFTISKVAISPDGKYCITIVACKAIIWNLETVSEYKRLSGLSGLIDGLFIDAVAFSSDGKYCQITFEKFGGKIKKSFVWNVKTGEKTKGKNINFIYPKHKKLISVNKIANGIIVVEGVDKKFHILYHIPDIFIDNCDFNNIKATDTVKRILYQNNASNVENPPVEVKRKE